MELEKKLNDLFTIINEEIKTNPDFAKRLEALFLENKAGTKKKKKRNQAVLNPERVMAQGEKQLRKELLNLDIEQLKDIVSEFGMDPSRLVMKWKKAEKIVDHIVQTAKHRSSKGDAFRAK